MTIYAMWLPTNEPPGIFHLNAPLGWSVKLWSLLFLKGRASSLSTPRLSGYGRLTFYKVSFIDKYTATELLLIFFLFFSRHY